MVVSACCEQSNEGLADPDGITAAVVLRSDQVCFQNWMDPEIRGFFVIVVWLFWVFCF